MYIDESSAPVACAVLAEEDHSCNSRTLGVPVHCVACYGVATISRLLKIIGLFCRIQSLLQGSFAKETYHCKEPTNQFTAAPATALPPSFVSRSRSSLLFSLVSRLEMPDLAFPNRPLPIFFIVVT